MPFKIFTQL